MTGEEAPQVRFLKPGELVASERPLIVSTLLGSCVAVTLFSPGRRLGAICHALLPSCRSESPCSHHRAEAGKYVQCAIWHMLEWLSDRGVERREIQAKVFGGADMFDPVAGNNSVGSQNIEMALGTLESESVRLVTRDLGGRRGRKLIFHTHTGDVFLKRLRTTES
jgi:chemotaxis protein CheD